MAHEAAHLVQGGQAGQAGGASDQLSSPTDHAEREADAAASSVVAGQTPQISGASAAAGIHRTKRSRTIGGVVGGVVGGVAGAVGGFFLGGVGGAVAGGLLGAAAGGAIGAGIGELVGGPDFTPEQEALARELAAREGQPDDWRDFLDQARIQLGTLAQSQQLDGDLDWNNQSLGLQNTEFGVWLLNNGPEPDPSSGQMNCWEMVMFSAYLGGYATKDRLAALYQTFATDLGNDINTGITDFENALRGGQAFVYDRNDPDSPKPLAGDIVIFQNLGAHVAIAIGEDDNTGEIEIMSLWTQNSRHTFRTTVENLLDNEGASEPVRFFSPNW